MRRAKNRTVKFSMTMPLNIFNELERYLSYDQSRSAFISSAVATKMQKDNSIYFDEIGTDDLLSALEFRFPKDSAEDIHVQALIKLCRGSNS